MKNINWLGVVLGLVVNQAVGMLWYGMLFMDRWVALELGGVEPTAAAANAGLWQGAILGLFQSFGLAWLIALLNANSFIKGGWVGLFVSFFFCGGVIMQNLVYAGDPVELISINASYCLVWLTLAGAVIGGVRWPAKKAG